jgi:hypothetical protein
MYQIIFFHRFHPSTHKVYVGDPKVILLGKNEVGELRLEKPEGVEQKMKIPRLKPAFPHSI